VTISDAIERINSGIDFYVALGDFLDDFYRENNEMRQAMIEDEPIWHTNTKKEYMALLAATSHKLANDYGLSVPTWVMNKKYRMTESPYFDCNAKGNLRLLFMFKSPTEFKHKNLFVDENFLSRV